MTLPTTDPTIAELEGRTVLVTGATGFLGGALARQLAGMGVFVRAFIRRPGRDAHLTGIDRIHLVTGDLTNQASLMAAAEGCDTVFHVAAALGGSLEQQQRVNIDGSRHVMEAAAAAQVRRVVHVSTISVYGYHHISDVTELTPMRPAFDPYSRTKAAAEDVVREVSARHALPVSIIRPGMIYGPRSRAWTAGIFRIARRRPTLFIGDGSGSAYPIFVDDVVALTILLAVHPHAAGEVFNCTPDPSPTWREFVGHYAALAGHDRWFDLPPSVFRPIAWLAGRFSPSDSLYRDLPTLLPFLLTQRTYRMDKARTLLGWQPQMSLAEGIQQCVPWLHEIGLLP